MASILLIEDDCALNEGLTYSLEKAGYLVYSALNAAHGFDYLNKAIDLVILDINLPDVDGLTIAARLKRFHQLPILFLTARDEERDILKGYALGCEDYITKPFSLPVVLEKIKIILRRQTSLASHNCYYYREFTFDFDRKIFKRADETLVFTATEIKLLQVLVGNKNSIITKEQLIDCLWGMGEATVDANTLSVNIRRLRKKIETTPSKPYYIKTVFGIGYKWNEA